MTTPNEELTAQEIAACLALGPFNGLTVRAGGSEAMTTLTEAMAECSREPSAEEQEQKDWIHTFVGGAVARVHERFQEEPQAEPERAAWHFNRNMALDTECWAARAAYADRFGHQMPEHWANTVHILKQDHYTNPYPNSTVRKMALGN